MQDFYETHRAKIELYRAAGKYLKGVLQKRYDPKKLLPISKWKEERETLQREKGGLNTEYRLLKNEIREVEIIRKYAEELAQTIEPLKQKTRARVTDI